MNGMRGKCPHCGKMISVRRDGKLRGHGEGLQDYTRMWCPGSGQVPDKVVHDGRSRSRRTSNPLTFEDIEDLEGEPRL